MANAVGEEEIMSVQAQRRENLISARGNLCEYNTRPECC